MKIGIEGFTFDSGHYTRGSSGKCLNLHGHTFRLDVEVEGEIDPKSGMVIDFILLKRIVNRVLEDYDHKIIVPKQDCNSINFSGPFKVDVKVIDYPEATTEYIALDIAKNLHERLGVKVRVKLYEGVRSYVIAEYPEDR